MEAVLRGAQIAQEARVPAVAYRAKILRIELREERIAIVQVWVMCAEARLKNLAAVADRVEPLARSFAVAIVSPQIAKRLFAFKDHSQSRLFSPPTIRGYVDTVPALGQTNFHRARGKPVRLRPEKREPFQLGMPRRFAAATCYALNHFARSRGQRGDNNVGASPFDLCCFLWVAATG